MIRHTIVSTLCASFALAVPPAAAAELPAADPEAVREAPDLDACSTRYMLVSDLAPPLAARDAKRAIRDGFDVKRQWGTKRNVEVLPPAETGLGEPALRVTYPEGTSAPSDNGKGGAGFYSRMALPEGLEAACLRYQVRFEDGFDFVKGGKLPGLYGGKPPSGGDRADKGFTMRFMWRENGQGELYEYIANKPEDVDYGLSVGRGLWTFPTGRWVTVEQELILNDPEAADGIARVWIDGKPILEQTGIAYRTDDAITIDGLMFSTFFGGSGEAWRTPRDQTADFADFRLYAPAEVATSVAER